jgi:hypothetical protein
MSAVSPSRPAAPAAKPVRRPQSGPPLLAPVLAMTVLTVGYVIVNRATPRPDASGAEVLRYAAAHGTQIAWGSLLLFASAVPLVIASAVLYRRLRALGITAPGSAITLVGGVLASGALILSALFSWAGGRLADGAQPALARALADLSFLAGGPGYVVTYALLIAGVSVTCLLARLLSRPLAWTGLALAVLGMLSMFTLVAHGAGFLLPVVRFGGLVWLVWVAAVLPRSRPRTARA